MKKSNISESMSELFKFSMYLTSIVTLHYIQLLCRHTLLTYQLISKNLAILKNSFSDTARLYSVKSRWPLFGGFY